MRRARVARASHVPEQFGGSGFGLPELVVVVEELGRAIAPGPVRAHRDRQRRARRRPATTASAKQLLPGLADGSPTGAVALGGSVEVRDGAAHGSAGVVLGGGLADVLLVAAGDDVAVVDVRGRRRRPSTSPRTSTRPAARPGSRSTAPRRGPPGRRVGRCVDLARAILSRPRRPASPASAPSRRPTTPRSAMQFGRPIAMFQAVKHHCANMLVATELATAAVWDAARAADGRRRPVHATPRPSPPRWPLPAADLCANLNIQVHGGIGFTWEHDAHLYLRRATALERDRSTPRRRRSTSPTCVRTRRRTGRSRRPAARGRADPRRGPGVRRERRGLDERRPASRADRDPAT